MKTTIITNKKTEYSIIIPQDSSLVEKTAATELREYIKRALGVELSIKNESENSGKAFYIGHTNYALSVGINGKSKENWVVKMHKDNIIFLRLL